MDFLNFKRLIAPLQRKIFLLLGRALLTAIDNSEGTQKIQATVLSGETINDIERFQEYGFESYPLSGAEPFIVFLNGNRNQGVVLCVHDRRYRPTDLAPGESAVYHHEGHRVIVKAGGIIEVEGTEIKIGDVTGALEKLLNKLAMDIYNAHTHSQGPDSDGNAQVDTGVPNTLMVENTDTTVLTKGN